MNSEIVCQIDPWESIHSPVYEMRAFFLDPILVCINIYAD